MHINPFFHRIRIFTKAAQNKDYITSFLCSEEWAHEQVLADRMSSCLEYRYVFRSHGQEQYLGTTEP